MKSRSREVAVAWFLEGPTWSAIGDLAFTVALGGMADRLVAAALFGTSLPFVACAARANRLVELTLGVANRVLESAWGLALASCWVPELLVPAIVALLLLADASADLRVQQVVGVVCVTITLLKLANTRAVLLVENEVWTLFETLGRVELAPLFACAGFGVKLFI